SWSGAADRSTAPARGRCAESHAAMAAASARASRGSKAGFLRASSAPAAAWLRYRGLAALRSVPAQCATARYTFLLRGDAGTARAAAPASDRAAALSDSDARLDP